MNKQQEDYVNSLVTAVSTVLTKDSTNSDIFIRTRKTMDEIIESGVLEFDSEIQKKIYNALITYRNSLRKGKNEN